MAADFDNTTMQVTLPSGALRGLTAITMMAWLKLDSNEGHQGFLSINGSTGIYQKVIGLYTTSSAYLQMAVRHATRDALASDVPPSVGQWHHVCGRWDASHNNGRPGLVVDGVVRSPAAISPEGAQLPDDGPLMVGAAAALGLLPLDGKMADPAIFDRWLSDEEVRLIVHGRLRANHLDPVWHLSLEGITGTAAVGDMGLRDTVGPNSINALGNPPAYHRDPPLHWPGGGVHQVGGGRATLNSRPTMNVAPGVKRATMRRAT